jgi:hypothetical protein
MRRCALERASRVNFRLEEIILPRGASKLSLAYLAGPPSATAG